jgi:hypothetical protein
MIFDVAVVVAVAVVVTVVLQKLVLQHSIFFFSL